jgi:4-coumarate--CoA ligase
VKGFQVAPAEIEDLLLKNPDVADAAVIGIPTEGNELVRAYIVPARQGVTAESIESYIRTQLARHKWLTGGVKFVESIPKSPSGKILRRHLRDSIKGEVIVKRQQPMLEERVMARL